LGFRISKNPFWRGDSAEQVARSRGKITGLARGVEIRAASRQGDVQHDTSKGGPNSSGRGPRLCGWENPQSALVEPAGANPVWGGGKNHGKICHGLAGGVRELEKIRGGPPHVGNRGKAVAGALVVGPSLSTGREKNRCGCEGEEAFSRGRKEKFRAACPERKMGEDAFASNLPAAAQGAGSNLSPPIFAVVRFQIGKAGLGSRKTSG